ncbi:glutamine synthetase-like protein [Amycolatopsis mediterranei S699]|jgi:glutamine synthetase|uniref:Glutamine synthetase-like protein n=2 Tax=Amycolatopsis mediterranei TaxID=33910 RepID=A0A0H3CY72_AMYMU|nr:type I glutamate--ammonia ligase [Amycolatopsis mediterranei]ADJ43035.1 glutamine synthetase-like protein [Amycolatopsis mediterranei U32]AEK39730.1 glutamine synthetase [Amycolatopsis mediterranei S699]AFO74749.1 glutamine synthetase-like protein [Amycolatopsis mediterranei S699]AGT81878.1 glutamine synthetase-like protein [Amycolatopsis mediterranei RB]KDO04298.1 glutamine synthetase [Amycolatopsis mediterranei]
MDRQQEFVLRTLEERDIRFVRLWFTDVLGFLKSVAVAPAELEGAFNDGIGFDGSAIEGFARVYESDMVAKPDPSTFQVLPWETPEGGPYSARMFCDIAMPDGSPSWADPRHVLRRQLSKAAEAGFTCYVHPEIEFFLLSTMPDDGSEPEPADNGGYFDQASHATATHFRRHAIETLEAMGISVEFSHHEGAPGQQEIDLRYADALTMADNVMTFRYVVKEVALTQGVRATFMPKPFTDQPGSGMHTHVSLFEGDRNAFYDAEDPHELSETGKAFVAGVLHHAKEISAVTNQWVNSYKRLISGSEAPTTVSWGRANRSALVRVPMYSPGKASSRRVEIRTLDSACNPYLAYSVILAAGLKGIEKGYELPPPAEDNIWQLSDSERRAAGYSQLPQNLGEALAEMEKSELLPEALGEHVYDFFLRNKRVEWDNYRSAVTPYELRTLLPVL